MKCPKCQFDNREGANFCKKCGVELKLTCPQCNTLHTPDSLFCDECGCDLQSPKESFDEISETESQPPHRTTEKPPSDVTPIVGERKHVTVLFSDLSGYTSMSERLDPEEIKDITSKIFDEISKIIGKYEGFIEKFVGDAVMALFGATEAHEDDPVRAIKAAREIHNVVDALSPQYEERIEHPLAMHTGINTGLVVTGEVNLEKGTHGVAGDTINVAARLSDLGSAGDILVSPDTFYQSEGYFDFKEMAPATIKGKSKSIRVYKVIAQKEQPIKIHRLRGFQADLIGRKVEMNQLAEAARKLNVGSGTVFNIFGPAGTGKSRLIKEFKETLNLDEIQWLEGHAYPHSQNIPYFPLIDLLNRSLQIKEGDPPERVREKIESGISSLVGENTNFIPYIGSLYSLSYPEIDEVSPAFWKEQLQKAIQTILSVLAQGAPTIIRLEDLHWADPSFLELIRVLLSDSRDPILFLCVYRPIISLFTGHQINAMTLPYQEIRLQDLSASESQSMVESLLKTDSIPEELQRFLQDKVEGNPFYIEEVINSLIESDTLIRDNGDWKLNKAITEAEISSTIHGVISSRLDHLEKESKRILQEASVIGRTFFYEILNRITDIKDQINYCLRSLERLDLIRARTFKPDLEYIFKHALTQEVVYNGVLKKERQVIHDRIGLVIEQLFRDRLPEVYETLAHHFKRGRSLYKAINYLMKSGEKSVKRYALEESHQYYKEAYELITNGKDINEDEGELLIDLLLKWAFVYYYRADFKGMSELFRVHERLAESLRDREKVGMFNAWFGFILGCREQKQGMDYLRKALQIGEEIDSNTVIGYTCTWLTWICAEQGLLDEAIIHGKRAQDISSLLKSDHYLYFKSLGGLALVYVYKGEKNKVLKAGKKLLEYGQRLFSTRSKFMGYVYIGYSHLMAGDFQSGAEYIQKAIQVSVDPLYEMGAGLNLVELYIQNGQYDKAEEIACEIADNSQKLGCECWGTPACMFLGISKMAKGQMNRGLRMIEEAQQSWLKVERPTYYAISEWVLGKIYLQFVEGASPISLSTVVKNIGFLAKNVPFASKKAEYHFNKAILVAQNIGAKGYLAQAYLDLGLLHKLKKRIGKAKECVSKAIELFEQCEADVYLKQANEALESLQ